MSTSPRTRSGVRPRRQTLGAEHRTAHQIIAETIAGVITDLWGYHDGRPRVFEAGMGTADATAAEDLQRPEAAVRRTRDVVGAATTASRRYRDSQRKNLAAPVPDVPGGEGPWPALREGGV